MKYEEVYGDWSFLFETVGFACDMTGGYVDSKDLEELLKKPTKATAKTCLIRQITYWFSSGIEYNPEHVGKTIHDLIDEYPRIVDIADTYCCDINECPERFVDAN